MKPLVWVKLLFRAMGVLFIGLALPQCFQLVSQLLSFIGSAQMRASWAADWWQMFYTLGWGGGGFVQLGLGLYLLFWGKRLREWCMRDEAGKCPRCDYECGPGMAVCPECGLPLTGAAIQAASDRVAVAPSRPAASEVQQTLPSK